MGLTPKHERRWLVLIFSLYILLGICYSLVMPIWEAPDEPAHYHLAWHVARIGEYATPQHNYEAHQPRPYYYLASLVIRALDKIDPHYSDYVLVKEYKQNFGVPERRFDWTPENYRFLLGVYTLRWVNILIGAIALGVNWKAFRLIAPDDSILRLSVIALAALTPQYLHITSSVNNDTLGALAGAVVFYLTLRIAAGASNLLIWISIALAVILPLTTKLTVLPAGIALIAAAGWKQLSQVREKKFVVYSALVVVAILLLFYFLFNDALGFAANEVIWRLFSLRHNALTPYYLWFIFSQITWTYWGKVGWLAVGLPGWTVILLASLGWIGASLQARRLLKEKTAIREYSLWVATWLVALFTVAAVMRNGLTTAASQGRFLFPAIGALSLLMISGWHKVLPDRIRQNLHWIVLILMLCCNIGVIQFSILPTYFQSFLDQ
jgi:hypothetical protein